MDGELLNYQGARDMPDDISVGNFAAVQWSTINEQYNITDRSLSQI
jgi:hypothetical protein